MLRENGHFRLIRLVAAGSVAMLAVGLVRFSTAATPDKPPTAPAKPAQGLTAADLTDTIKLGVDNAPKTRWSDLWLEDMGKAQASAGDFAGAEVTAKQTQGDGSERIAGRIIAVRAAKEGKDVVAEVRRLKLHILNEIAVVEIVRTEARAGRVAAARAIAGMLEQGVYASQAWFAVVKNSREKGDLQKAMGSFRKPPQDEELIEVAEAEAACGDVARAMQTVERLKKEGFQRSEALWRITRTQALAGDIEGAKASAEKITVDQSINHVAQAWACIAMVLAGKGDVEGTKAAIEKVPGTLRKPRIAALLAYAQARSGDLGAARATARSLSGGRNSADSALGFAYGLIAAAEADRGDIATARAAIKLGLNAFAGARSNSDKAVGALLILEGAIYGPRAIEGVDFVNYE